MPETSMDLRIRAKNLASRALKEVQREMSVLGRGTTSVTRSIMSSFGNMARTVGRHLFSLKGAIAALGLGMMGKSFLEAAKLGESLRLRLVALLGSIKEGTALFKDLAKYAGQVPFEYQEIMKSATMLAGIMKGGRTEIMRWMPLIGDLAAATGLGIEQTTSQIMRMLSAGAAAADMFRERGVLALLGFTAGVKYSVEDTKKMLWEAWTATGSRFRGLTGEMAKSWEGMMSMLRDAWFQFRTAVMEAGLFDFMKAGLKLLLDGIGRLKKEGKIDEWAQRISNAILRMAATTNYAVAAIIDAFRGWQNIIMLVKKGLLEVEVRARKVFATANDWLSILNPELERYAEGHRKLGEEAQKELDEINRRLAMQESAILNAQERWKNFERELQKAIEGMKKVGNEANMAGQKVINAAKAGGQAIKNYLDKAARDAADAWVDFRNRVEEVTTYTEKQLKKVKKENDGVTSDMSESWQNLSYDMRFSFENLFYDTMVGDIHSLGDFWKSFCQSMKETFIRAAADILANKAVQSLLGGGKGGKGGVASGLLNLIGGLGQGVSGIWNFVSGIGGGIWNWLGGLFHSGGGVMKGGLYSLEGGEYVVPRERVSMLKAMYGQSNLDRILGGKTSRGKRSFQTGGYVYGGQEQKQNDWLGEFFTYIKQIRGVQWLYQNIIGPIYQSLVGTAGLAGGVFGGTGSAAAAVAGSPTAFAGRITPTMGGGQNPITQAIAPYTKGISNLWSAISPYLTVAGLGYLGGGLLGSVVGPRWFGTTGQYGGYGGTVGALGGYAVGTTLGTFAGLGGGVAGGAIAGGTIGGAAGGGAGGVGLGATLGSWAGPIGAVVGGILGAILGSAIGPTAHKTESGIMYNLSGQNLLSGNWGPATVTVRSTHGKSFAAAASNIAAQGINTALLSELPKYQEKLMNLPHAMEIAKAMSPLDLGKMIPGLTGGRSKHLGQWINQAAGVMPEAISNWWDTSLLAALMQVGAKYPSTFGPEPWRWWGGQRYRTGIMGWSATGTPVPFAGYYQQGGIIPKTGLAYVHKGEEVVPKEGAKSSIIINNNIYVSAIDASDFKRKIRREILPEIEDRLKGYGHIRYTVKDIK